MLCTHHYQQQLDQLKRLLSQTAQKVKEESYKNICDFYRNHQDRANQLVLLLSQPSLAHNILSSSWAKERGLKEDNLERLQENRLRYKLDASFIKALPNILDLSDKKVESIFGQNKESVITLLDYMFLEIYSHELIVFQYLIGGEATSHFFPFKCSPYPKGSPYYISREDVFKCVENHLTKDNNHFFLHHLSQTIKRTVDAEEIKGTPIIDMFAEGMYSQVLRVEATLTTRREPVKFAIQTPINLAESQDNVIQDYENLIVDFRKNPWFVPETYGLYEEPIEGRVDGRTLLFFVEEWLNVRELHIQENENGRRFIIWDSLEALDPDEVRSYRPMQTFQTEETHRYEVIVMPPLLETHIHLGDQDNQKAIEMAIQVKTIYYNLVRQEAIGMFEINTGDLAYEAWETDPRIYLTTHRTNRRMALYDFFINDVIFLRASEIGWSKPQGFNEIIPVTYKSILLNTKNPYPALRGFYRGLVENIYSMGMSINERIVEAEKHVFEVLSRFRMTSNETNLTRLFGLLKSIPQNQCTIGDLAFLHLDKREVIDVLEKFKAVIPKFLREISSTDTMTFIEEDMLRRDPHCRQALLQPRLKAVSDEDQLIGESAS